MRLFHATTAGAAEAILAGGFRDATGTYGTDREFTGVWLSDRPLEENEGTAGSEVLEVSLDLPDAEVAQWEWVQEEPGTGYREFLIPAEVINRGATVRAVSSDELDALFMADRVVRGESFLAPTADPDWLTFDEILAKLDAAQYWPAGLLAAAKPSEALGMIKTLRDDKDWPLIATIERHDPDRGSVIQLFKQERFFTPDDYREAYDYHMAKVRGHAHAASEFS